MRIRVTTIFVLMLLFAADVFAQADRATRDQERAATEAAVRGLKEAVVKEVLAPGLNVGTFLDKADGHERLANDLARAEKIGGTRWVDNTAQVRLEISGQRVVKSLVAIAATKPRSSPIAADVLAVKLKDWNQRTFSSTGSSTGAAEIEHARPGGEAAAWARVSDEARRAAVAAAKDNAINQALDSVRDVMLPNGQTAGDALKDKAVREKLTQWLATRPVTQVEFRDDLNVGVELAAPPAEFFEAFRDALRAGEPDAAAWDNVRADFERRLSSPSGTAAVGGGREGVGGAGNPVVAGTAPKGALQLPSLPPAWTNEVLDAEGSATAGGSKLKCARMAEAEAAKLLAAQVEKLPLSDTQTIGRAAEGDPRVRDAVERAAGRGRTYKVEYDANGGARVWVQLDLRHVWNELRAVR
jgi:hypothetical protein